MNLDHFPNVLPPPRTRDLLAATVRLWTRHPLACLLLTGLPLLPFVILRWLFDLGYLEGVGLAADGPFARLVFMLLQALAPLTMMGGVVELLARSAAGRPAPIRDLFRAALPGVFPAVIACLVAGLFVVLGAVMLVIPGIVIGMGLYVAIPVAAVERCGVATALDRSRALVSGSRWRIFFLNLVSNLAFLVLTAGAVAASTSEAVAFVAIVVLGLASSLVNATLPAVVYHDRVTPPAPVLPFASLRLAS